MHPNSLIDQVFGSLMPRKLYHVLGGLLVTGMLIYLKDGFWLYMLGVLYVILFAVWGSRISFAVLGVLILGIFTHSRFACAGAYLILAIGDGSAAIVGSRYGTAPWPWQRNKTILGSAAFLVTSFAALTVFIRYATLASISGAMWMAILPALVGTLAECSPIRIIRDSKPDDNLLIILSSGLLLNVLVNLFSVPVIR